MPHDRPVPAPAERPRALVVGGSLAGLLAATTLRAAGWKADVFERSPQPLESRGGGLVLQPDVLEAFRFAGIPPDPFLGVTSDDRIYLDAHDRVISRSFMPQTQTSWNKLYGTMRNALPENSLHAGERLVSFKQSGDGVTALFASGRIESGDILVGADGAMSTLRTQLQPASQPRYAGYVAWRGLVPERMLGADAAAKLAGTFAFQQGRDHLLLEYRIPGEDGSVEPGRRRWNWVWFRKVSEGPDLTRLLTDRLGAAHRFSLPPGEVAAGPMREMRQAAVEHLAPSFSELVLATEEPFIQAIIDLAVPRMVTGRAILIGDAAFVPRPHTAGGAAKAAADAVTLARALQGGARELPERLARWETDRLAAGAAMCKWGISIGDRIMGLA
jgi:2-polyprenyl-6-methoxyphenol hydroxylase-like FAD-dependent oxidoreductase